MTIYSYKFVHFVDRGRLQEVIRAMEADDEFLVCPPVYWDSKNIKFECEFVNTGDACKLHCVMQELRQRDYFESDFKIQLERVTNE